jgi:hypothetical protein
MKLVDEKEYLTMDYGQLMKRAWNLVWEHKFLILLGVLVALGSGGGGNAGNAASSFGEGGAGVQLPRDFEFSLRGIMESISIPRYAAISVVIIAGVLLIVGLAVWVLSLVSRGGLIAGVNELDAGQPSNFSEAFRAGWQKVWTLLGIGLIPAIPALLLAVLGAIAAAFYVGNMRVDVVSSPNVGMTILTVSVTFVLIAITVVLSLLQAFANRACMLEDERVFAAYKRGFSVLMSNVGSALVLFLIQIAVSVAIGLIMILPSIVMALCCLLWPLLILIQGAISAYFSTLWTLAWRQWTGQTA